MDYPSEKGETPAPKEHIFGPLQWEPSEAIHAAAMDRVRRLSSFPAADSAKHLQSLHVWVLGFLEQHASLITKKVDKMIVGASGLSVPKGAAVVKSPHGLRVLECLAEGTWPSALQAEPLLKFFIRLTETGCLVLTTILLTLESSILDWGGGERGVLVKEL